MVLQVVASIPRQFFNGLSQFLPVQRLGEDQINPGPWEVRFLVLCPPAGKQDDRSRGVPSLHLFGQCPPAHDRHAEIGQNHIKIFLPDQVHRFLWVMGGGNGVTGSSEHVSDHFQNHLLIIYHKDMTRA